MCSLMSTDSVWYLNTVEYDESVWPGGHFLDLERRGIVLSE